MRIDKLVISNFRQLKDIVLEFPKTSATDIHVILGKNGMGKTNILNAITWCLYGDEMHLGDKDRANAIINNSAAREYRKAGDKTGDVKVELNFTSEEDDKKLIISRTAQFAIKQGTPLEISSARTIKHTVNGEWRIENDEEMMASLILKYVPKAINEYIFFDGEHLEQYFQAGQLDKIKTAINEFTQANVLDSAIKGFVSYSKNVLSPKISECGDDQIEELSKFINQKENERDDHLRKIETLEEQKRIANEQIEKYNEIIAGNVAIPDKTKRLVELEGLIDKAVEEKKKVQKELYKFSREYYVYLNFYPAMSKYYKYIKKQEREGKLPPKIDKQYLLEILHEGTCPICDNLLNKHAIENINALIERLDVSTATSAELNKTMTALAAFFDDVKKYPALREKHMSELQEAESKIQEYEDEHKNIEAFLKTVPDAKAISKAIDERKQFKEAYDSYLTQIGEENAQVKGYKEIIEKGYSDLNKLIEKNKKMAGIAKQNAFCQNCANMLGEIKEEVLEECRAELTDETFQTFKNLIWKKDAFSRVEIDESYNFKLFDTYENQTLGSCSAAERALLALSFTLALQKISKHDSLLFIDTPIGRVDDDNRGNMIETLLEIATNKQVILTFTPTEYDDNVKAQLAGRISTFNELVMEAGNTKNK